MGNFLDVARDLVRLGRTEGTKHHFETVFRGISQLQQVHSKAQLDIHNIESVFAAFDMAYTLGQFGSYNSEEIKALAESTRILIAKTIEETLQFPVIDGRISTPPPYDAFVDMIRYARDEAKPYRSVAVITFNYDIALDFALGRFNFDLFAVDISQRNCDVV